MENKLRQLVQQVRRHQQGSICPQSPIWQIVEAISFGLLSMMYKNLKHESRTEIARHDRLEGAEDETWLHNLTHLRNLCSHHCRLWNRQFTATAGRPQTINILKERWNLDSARIYNSLLVIGYLLSKIPFQSEWGSLIGRLLDEFLESYPERYMGFPSGWKREHICNWQS
ncbi:MAG: Abi family protein [Betaproteobacteria bacterium]|nr:Abi family protein [Betaproteobacteria bacterium]